MRWATHRVNTGMDARPSWLSALIADARAHPGRALAIVVTLHVIVWTALPALLSHNLQLDLAEALALGREWQLGYWKLPPLPWWLADLAVRATGTTDALYLLGPLSIAVCFTAVWRLGLDVAAPAIALIAVLALEGAHYFNFTAVKFNHDVLQLPLWALTGLCLYRAIMRESVVYWIAAGVMLALAAWTKYSAAVLGLSMALFVLADPVARRSLRTPGPYLMVLAFAVVLGPHLYWLYDNNFIPFRYADTRARIATHWYQFFLFPLQWIGGQIFFLLPTLGLIALMMRGRTNSAAPDAAFARRYVTMLAFGPFAAVTLIALAFGRLPIAMWGYPLWSFLPLAALMWFGVDEAARVRRFAMAFLVVFAAMPLAYLVVEGFEPLWRDRPKATQFPGPTLAKEVTQRWREKYSTPLPYVGGGEFATNLIAIHSADRPRVIVHADPALSPWVDRNDLRARGAVLVWEDGQLDAEALARLRSAYPGLAVQEPLILPRRAWVRASTLHPVRVHYALVPPRP